MRSRHKPWALQSWNDLPEGNLVVSENMSLRIIASKAVCKILHPFVFDRAGHKSRKQLCSGWAAHSLPSFKPPVLTSLSQQPCQRQRDVVQGYEVQEKEWIL